MDRERSSSKDQASSDWKDDREIKPQDKIEDIKKIQSISHTNSYSIDLHDNHQITSFQESFWIGAKQSFGFHFNRGILWGIAIGFTIVLSASFGVALTRIDAVEEIIHSAIDRNGFTKQSVSKNDLTHPVNILLLEVEPGDDKKNGFSQEFVGKSTTVLLLKLNPQLNTVEAINIPTDSRVKIPGFGWGTIEDANRYGGTPLVSQAIVRLLNDITIDRYIRATPATFQKLIASGKIALNNCDSRIEDCSNRLEQVSHQQAAIETIRQRLNIPSYLKSFTTTLKKIQSDLDTNLSLLEAMSIADFVKELESDNIHVELVSGYVPGKSLKLNNKLHKSHFSPVKPTSNKPKFSDRTNYSASKDLSFKSRSIAVQNTTNSPELAMRFVSYLRQQNFHDVYLVEHIPLKLDKTRIVLNRSQLERAEHLKSIIGFGKIEPFSPDRQRPLTVQIGRDARYLPLKKYTD